MAPSQSINESSILQRGLLKKASRGSQAGDARLALSVFRGPYFVQFTVFFVAYCIAGKLGQATTNIRSSNLGPVWPAYGIALAAFLVCGYWIWPAIASGAFLIAFFSPVTHLAALGQAAGATLAALSGAFLLQRVAKFDKSLSRLRDGLALIVLGAVGSAAVSASIGTSVLYATEVHPYSGLGSAWLIYWLGDATGVLLVTPVVLTLPRFLRIREQARITELVVLFVLLTAACSIIFGDPSLIPVRLHVLAFAVLPFVIWAAIRFEVMGAGLSVLLIATIATVATALGSGPFATGTPFTNAVLLDAFFAVLSVTGITLASVMAEREQAERGREQSVRERAALEARLEAEQVVRASEERLRLAQQAANIGAFEWNIQTGMNTWTPELEAMYGLPPGGFGGTQTAWENLVHRDDLGEVLQWVNEALKTGRPMTGEWRVVWPDESVHWIAGRWQVFMDASGEPSRMLGVNIDVTERKRSEEKLREYEKAVEGAEDMIGVIDREYRFLLANRQYLKMRNLTREQVVGHFIPEIVNREVFETVIKPKLDECFQGKVVEYEMKFSYPAVGERDLLLTYFPIEGVNGVDRVACILHDITDRKRAEEALSSMTRRLVQAHEQERARIGRELHDDISQRLAMLAIELEQLRENPSELGSRVQELQKQTREISNDVQALSHELHASKLDYLGVVAGIRSLCREFGERQGIEINFKTDVASRIPTEIGLTLFRVSQEALHNAVRHSGVKQVEVQLSEHPNEILLTISDTGRGFEIDAARQSGGLGLASMEERVRLVKGSIVFGSKPMGGTTIHVRVPFESEPLSRPEAV